VVGKFIATIMKKPELEPPHSRKGTLDDIIGDLFHDAQNSVHLVGMELELVTMGLGNNSDLAKTAALVKRLENNLRDLRGYISILQEPSATCDPAAVLEGVITNLQLRTRHRPIKLRSIIPQSMPRVLAHTKLLSRVLERVFEFCEDLLHAGGELGILAERQQLGSQTYAEINVTMVGARAISNMADEDLAGLPSDRGRTNAGIGRALDVLRSHGGETTFRRHSDCECELTIRMSAFPG
jgi:hypothetical protein